jgi:hypothetical protein
MDICGPVGRGQDTDKLLATALVSAREEERRNETCGQVGGFVAGTAL